MWIQEKESDKAWMWKHKGLLSKRERELDHREESLTAHSAELSESKAKLGELELNSIKGEQASWLKQLCPEVV